MCEITLWRVNLKPQGPINQKIKEFCFNNGYLAMGWSCVFDNTPTREEYFSAIVEKGWTGGYKQAYKAITQEMKIGDLCLSRDNTFYYIGEITSEVFYANCAEHYENCFSWIRKVDWKRIGKQNETPAMIVGKLSESRQRVFTRVHNNNLKSVSSSTYNFLKSPHTEFVGKELVKIDNFANLMSYESLEDLVALYLQEKYKLLLLAKSGKKSTPEFEYILLDKTNKKSVFVQVKQNAVIDLQRYNENYKTNKVYVFSNFGYTNIEENDFVEIINKDDLFGYFKSNYKWVISEVELKYLGMHFDFNRINE